MKLLMYLKSMVYQQYHAALKKLQIPVSKYDLWHKVAKTLKLSNKACQRLDWIIFYHTKANKNASLTVRHFGIPRSQFYYWFNRFDEANLRSLEDKSTASYHTRQREINSIEEQRAIALRKGHMHWGKVKLAKLYLNTYKEKLSSWQFQRVIQIYKLYPKAAKNAKIQAKRQKYQKKKRITELKRKLPILGYLLHFDTIEIHWHGLKRYIITMIDHFTKIAFARMYATKSSKSARDFLLRVSFLLDGYITNAHQDNGPEFAKCFKELCKKLNITQYQLSAKNS